MLIIIRSPKDSGIFEPIVMNIVLYLNLSKHPAFFQSWNVQKTCMKGKENIVIIIVLIVTFSDQKCTFCEET